MEVKYFSVHLFRLIDKPLFIKVHLRVVRENKRKKENKRTIGLCMREGHFTNIAEMKEHTSKRHAYKYFTDGGINI